MKKILAIFLCVICLCSTKIITTSAASVNLCDDFQRAIYGLMWSMGEDPETIPGSVMRDDYGNIIAWTATKFNDISENESFYEGTILKFIYEKYAVIDGTVLENINGNCSYFIEANVFEARVNSLFANVNISKLRNCSSTWCSYNPTKKRYEGCLLGNYGGSYKYLIKGYYIVDDKYIVYGWLGDQYTKNELENAYYTGICDPISLDNASYLVVDNYVRCVLSYENNTVKYLSWENVDNIPVNASMITADTKISQEESMSKNYQTTIIESKSQEQNPSYGVHENLPDYLKQEINETISDIEKENEINDDELFNQAESEENQKIFNELQRTGKNNNVSINSIVVSILIILSGCGIVIYYVLKNKRLK